MNNVLFVFLIGTCSVLSFMCSTSPSIPPAVTPGLVAYYPLNGNVYDQSGNGYNGVLENSPALVGDRFGHVHSAYALNGNAEDIELPAAISLSTDLSISFWMQTTASDTSNWPFAMPVIDRDICDYARDWSVGMGLGGQIQFNTGTATADYVLTSFTSVNNGIWNHVVVVRNAEAGTKSIYINGQLDVSVYFDNQPFVNNDLPIYVGASSCSPSGHTYYQGSIDEIRIYNQALTLAQVQSLYHESGWGK